MRSGLYRVLFPEDVTGIPESELTLAEGLKTRGYQTMAIGKSHLGHNEEKYLPNSSISKSILASASTWWTSILTS